MATDLFGKYFNNPTKSYIYTNLTCNGASADEMSFDITGSNGVISDNESTLSSIDLSKVHVPITQYTTDMRIIDPYSFIYVKGFEYGDSYTSKSYGKVPSSITEDEDWLYKTTVFFVIKYLGTDGDKTTKYLTAAGSLQTETTFIEAIQTAFDNYEISIDVKHDDGYIVFTSNKLGYDFWIDHIMMCKSTDATVNIYDKIKADYNQFGLGYSDEWAEENDINVDDVFSSTNVYTNIITQQDYQAIYKLIQYLNSETNDGWDEDMTCIFIFEDLSKFVPCKKYRNGAMQGCVVVATYPEYNDESISYTQRSLKIGHLKNRIADYTMIPSAVSKGVPLAVKKIRDVVDSYHSQYEYDLYNKWSNEKSQINVRDEWIDPDEIPHVIPEAITTWEQSHVPVDYVATSIYRDMARYDAIGLHGYCTYLTKNNLWEPMGQIYLRTAVPDDESMATTNLIHSFVIYNPNSFPVTVKYMTFA